MSDPLSLAALFLKSSNWSSCSTACVSACVSVISAVLPDLSVDGVPLR